MRNRFLTFRDTDHASRMWSRDPRDKMGDEDSYYWRYHPKHMGDTHTGCCTEYLIAAHNYKMGAGDFDKEYVRLNEEHNKPKDWDTLPLPPRPRLFLYDPEKATFEFDRYRNTRNIPAGQRIYFGEDYKWYCWNCRENDRFWIDSWDQRFKGRQRPDFLPNAR